MLIDLEILGLGRSLKYFETLQRHILPFEWVPCRSPCSPCSTTIYDIYEAHGLALWVDPRSIRIAGLRLLAAALQKSTLVELELHLAGCVRLRNPGIAQLKENLPASLRSFKGSFKGTEVNRNFQNLIDFGEFKVSTSPNPLTSEN